MSYMLILRFGQQLKRNITVFGQTPQICGFRLFDQLLSWSGDECWAVNERTCRLFQVVTTAPGMETRVEMFGSAKTQALRLVLQGIAS